MTGDFYTHTLHVYVDIWVAVGFPDSWWGVDKSVMFLVSPPQAELNVTLPGGDGKERTFTVSTLLPHCSLIKVFFTVHLSCHLGC